jgi:hypothetical protein
MKQPPLKENTIPLLILSANGPTFQTKRQGCRDTWIPLLRPEISPFFLVGSPDLETDWRIEGDLLRLRCADDYGHLTDKIRLGLAAALAEFEWPWLFKCDDDTCINPWRFNGYPFEEWDQVGFIRADNLGASGAGYSLSRRAAVHVLSRWDVGQFSEAEDLHVGTRIQTLAGACIWHESGILPFCGTDWQPSLLAHWLKTPEAMHECHAQNVRHETGAASAIGQAPANVEVAVSSELPHRKLRPRLVAPDFPINGQIFVQIAAYREADLLATLRDLIARATDPGRLRIGLCWQRAAEDSLEEFSTDPRIRVKDVPWQQAKGLCWARESTQLLYGGEEFTMQMDGHMRFIEGWDDVLTRMLGETDAAKPILTAYPAHFVPGEELPPGAALQIQTAHFRENGTLNQYPSAIRDAESLSHPVPARFLAGGFFFTRGAHCREVPYDPMLYFSDEISMAVRSYTHGYDLFHPHRHIAWHFYVRKDAPRHWADHSETARKEGTSQHFWWLREWRSQMQHEQLFGLVDHGIKVLQGLGSVRSLADYERFAGLNFRQRKIHTATLAGDPPPAPYEDEKAWNSAMKQVIKA